MSWKRYNQCYWCGRNLSMNPNLPNFRTKEHVLPKSLGGKGNAANVRAACALCNHTRGSDTSWVPYKQHRQMGRVVKCEEAA